MARKGKGKESKLSYSGNLLVENRNGLIVNAMAWEASGTAERDTALLMLEQIAGTQRVTVGGDKGYDTANFISECRHMQVTPHVAQNDGRRGGSALDQRTTRHAGYRISQRKRKRIEECFGWLKTIALLRKRLHNIVGCAKWTGCSPLLAQPITWSACANYPRRRGNTGRSVSAERLPASAASKPSYNELFPLSSVSKAGQSSMQNRDFSAACSGAPCSLAPGSIFLSKISPDFWQCSWIKSVRMMSAGG